MHGWQQSKRQQESQNGRRGEWEFIPLSDIKAGMGG